MGDIKTPLCARLGIDHPVVLAPMAGITNPSLVAAVANAGGLGSHGCAATPVDKLAGAVTAIRQATNRPFNMNFFVHTPPEENAEKEQRLRDLLQPFFDEFDLGEVPAPANAIPPFGPEHLDVLMADPPPIVSFHFGLPDRALFQPLKDKGCTIISSATTVAEAEWLEAHGADIIVAQGAEAGGHRGTFLTTDYADAMVGTMALLPEVVDAVSVPVIAAGGIADGRGVAAALALGAQAAQIGTAFLLKDESSTNPAYRQALSGATGDRTRATKAFSGRPARAVINRYVEALAAAEHDLPDFPLTYAMNAALRQVSADQGSTDYSSFWAGQAVAMARPDAAGAFVESLMAETAAVLGMLPR